MKLFETSVIKELDKYTIEHEPITSIQLVERAAIQLKNEIVANFDLSCHFYVFAGQGNNGGDALALSRLLLKEGYQVTTYLCNKDDHLSSECKRNKEELLKIKDVRFSEVKNAFMPPKLTENDVIIDGLFGSGLNKPLEGGFAGLAQYFNDSPAKVIAIDIPSGLFGDDNGKLDNRVIVKADLTLTFQFPKISFLLSENEEYIGKVKVLDIQLHEEGIRKFPSSYWLLEKQEIASFVKSRSRFAHKGNFGHGLLFAGSFGKIGAAVLASLACMRSGIGLLTTHVPECGRTIMQTAVPEAMLDVDTFGEFIVVLPDLKPYSAIAVGPGIGTNTQTSAFLENLLSSVQNTPVVIDADALNIISSWPIIDHAFPKNCIITPHPKEFDRLAGKSDNSYQRLQKAQSFAKKYKIYVILKGAYTAIIFPNGECFFNTTGNPGMATAGSGDALTGILLGLLSQGYSMDETVLLGVYLHGLAGDLALKKTSEESLIARDIVEHIGVAFKSLKASLE